MTVAVSPSGKLVANSATLARLKALCEGDKATLASSKPKISRNATRDSVVRVAPAPSDEAVEALLGALLIETYVEAMRSFRLARDYTKSGEPVEMRDIHLHQAHRLARAFADLVEARSARGRREQRIVVQHVHSGGQAVGLVDRERAGK
jgi:hypothetical protein